MLLIISCGKRKPSGSCMLDQFFLPMLSRLLIFIYFWRKVNIWNVNCAREQHSFSTHEQVFLGKCQSFWDRKCPDLRWTRTPIRRIHIRARHLLSRVVYTHYRGGGGDLGVGVLQSPAKGVFLTKCQNYVKIIGHFPKLVLWIEYLGWCWLKSQNNGLKNPKPFLPAGDTIRFINVWNEKHWIWCWLAAVRCVIRFLKCMRSFAMVFINVSLNWFSRRPPKYM